MVLATVKPETVATLNANTRVMLGAVNTLPVGMVEVSPVTDAMELRVAIAKIRANIMNRI